MLRIFILILLLSSCGGGGGGSGSGGGGSSGSEAFIPAINSFDFDDKTSDANWIVTSAQKNSYETNEYNEQWGLSRIHASSAYSVLANNSKNVAGDGVKIAVIDSGIFATHVDLADNFDAANSYNYIDNNLDVSDNDGHGSFVASIAAGVKNSSGLHGVAYDAQIVTAKSIGEVSGGLSDGIAAINGVSIIDGVKVINASWGYGGYDSYSGQTSGASTTDIAVINALKNAKAADVLVVAAAGNDGDNYNDGQINGNEQYLSNPKPSAPALFANNSELAGYVLAVGSVDSNGRIADSSNICGVAKNYCLVAPGVSVAGSSQQFGIDYISSGSGTSYAAPFVSGAAAVLRSAWPLLTAKQTAQILLLTATDFGEEGVDEIYGRGMLNLYAAVQDYGSDNLVSGSSAFATGYSSHSSRILSDPIFGDAFSSGVSGALKNAVFFDDFGRDYKANLGDRIASRNDSVQNFNVRNILLNEVETKNIPLSFASKNGFFKTKINLQARKYNDDYLRFATFDNSQNRAEIDGDRGFSFAQKIGSDVNFGFGENVNALNFAQENVVGGVNFLSINDVAANPFQDFISGANSSNLTGDRKNFNQFFVNKSFLSRKLSFGFSRQSSYFKGYSGFSDDKMQNQIHDFNVGVRAFKDSDFTISFGRLDEFDNNFLNSKNLGAFEMSDDVKTNYAKISLTQKLLEEVFLIANFSHGQTRADGNRNGIFREFSDVKSKGFAVGLVDRDIFNAQFGVVYSQPMRVYSGDVFVDFAIARDEKTGEVLRLQDKISLIPNGRQENFELFLAKNFDRDISVSTNFIVVKDAGNFKRKKKDFFGMVNLVGRF